MYLWLKAQTYIKVKVYHLLHLLSSRTYLYAHGLFSTDLCLKIQQCKILILFQVKTFTTITKRFKDLLNLPSVFEITVRGLVNNFMQSINVSEIK